jgi:hypothetical protein
MSKTAKCKTCHHANRARIEMQLANGVSMMKIARQFEGLTKWGLSRHFRKHVSEARKNKLKVTGLSDAKVDLEALKRAEGESLLQNLVSERSRFQRLADTCESAGNFADSIRAASGVVNILSVIAKLLGEIRTGNTTINNSFLLSPDWLNIRRALATALRPFPEAQRSVLSALRTLESSAGVEITHAHAIERPALEHVREATPDA